MNSEITKNKLGIFFYLILNTYMLLSNLDSKNISNSEIRSINSILEAKELLDQVSPTTLVVFDIGETLAIQKNNLLRIIRNYRIFDKNDIHLKNMIISKFSQQNQNAKTIILSNMLLNSPLYFVEPKIKTILQNLQKRDIKVIAHCSSSAKSLGVIQNYKDWRFSVLKKMGIDLSSSFAQKEISLTKLTDKEGFYPIFYNGILFGRSKGKTLLAFLDAVKFTPSEIICFDDCEFFIKKYAQELKKRNINFKGFIYKAAVNPQPKLNPKIVDVQVKYMKRKKFIDDTKAQRIIKRRAK